MDPLSLTCNVAGVLTVAAQLISIGYSCGSSIADVPGEVRELIQELTSLSGILSALKAIIDQPPLHHSMNTQPLLITEFLSSPLWECEERLQSLLESLRSQEVRSTSRRIFRRLTWPLKEGDTKDLFARLERYKQLFSLAISADEMILKRSICNDIEELRKHQTIETEKKDLATRSERFLEIIRWVSPADSEINHVTARKLQREGTGKWFTGGEAYRNWLLPDNSFLWLHGKPGAGKTILSSITIDYVMSEVYTSSNIDPAVIYFYFDFKDALKQTAAGLLGSLISQLVRKKSKIPSYLDDLYNRSERGANPPDIYSLEECLRSIIREFSKVVVIIDAFDECVERVTVFGRLEWLKENTNLLVTSRNELDIKLQFEGLPKLLINNHDVSVDIKNFVTHELVRQPRLNRLKPGTKSDIVTALVNGANGMFRWAKCCLDEIAKLRSNKAIKSALKSLPRTLESSYERILCNIPEEDKVLAIRVFQWLLSSRRPLTVQEVVDAIAVEVGDVSMDLDSKLNDPEDITNICGSLVDLNRRNMTLGLAHFTVEEYLSSTGIAQGPAAPYQIQLQVANIELTKTCLTYILFDDFGTGPCEAMDELIARLGKYPLLDYIRIHWTDHIRSYKSGDDKILDDLILSLFRLDLDSGKYLSLQQAMATREWDNINSYKKNLTAPLIIAAEAGQLPAVKDLVERGADIQVTDLKGESSPLLIAAREGYLEMVRFLLDKGAGLGCHEYFRPLNTPMRNAAMGGFPEIVQLLLDYCSDSVELSEWVRYCHEAVYELQFTPHEGVMEVILATDYYKKAPTIEEANSYKGGYGQIEVHPFVFAFFVCLHHGWEKYIHSLWEIGSEIIISAEQNMALKICLLRAAADGQVKPLKILLQNDKVKSSCVKHSLYPILLQEAAYYGKDRVVDFLLGLREISGDESMGISLHMAAARGHVYIIERLLRAGANPLREDDDGWYPVDYASQSKEDSAREKLSSFTYPPNIKVGPTSWNLRPEEASVDGLEIKAKTRIYTRALRPINPLCVNYSFEVEIVEGSCNVIGLGDVTYSHTLNGGGHGFIDEPDKGDFSWGYASVGSLNCAYSICEILAERYGAGDIVGCYLEKTRNIAFFTLNGKITGELIANVKGKLVPMIDLKEGACIRTNFGDNPFIYPMPNLSVEVLGQIWKPYNNEESGRYAPQRVLV